MGKTPVSRSSSRRLGSNGEAIRLPVPQRIIGNELNKKKIVFPDGSELNSDQDPGRLWAVAAAPMELEAIQEIDSERVLQVFAEIHDLEEAVANPTVTTEASSTPMLPVIRIARLANTTQTTVVDEDDDVINLGRGGPESEPFDKSGEVLLTVLVSQATDRIIELRKSEEARFAGLGAEESDPRLGWRVVRWMASRDAAEKFANRLNERWGAKSEAVVLEAATL